MADAGPTCRWTDPVNVVWYRDIAIWNATIYRLARWPTIWTLQHIINFSDGYWISVGKTKARKTENWTDTKRRDLKKTGMTWDAAQEHFANREDWHCVAQCVFDTSSTKDLNAYKDKAFYNDPSISGTGGFGECKCLGKWNHQFLWVTHIYLPKLSQPFATKLTVICIATPTFQRRQLQANPEAADNASANDHVHLQLMGQLWTACIPSVYDNTRCNCGMDYCSSDTTVQDVRARPTHSNRQTQPYHLLVDHRLHNHQSHVLEVANGLAHADHRSLLQWLPPPVLKWLNRK